MKRILIILIILLPSISVAMVPLDDSELGKITGQSLLVADFIEAGSISGQDPNMSFFRMGLDGIVEMNMNIDKLQLGCGGYNESVRANSCDIDIDYVSLLGLNPNGTPKEGVEDSDFKLTRPYFELAIVEGAGGTREIAGFKIGAENALGYMGIGRRYTNGQVNEEYGGTCTNAANGTNALNCHSGINSISANINMNLEGRADGCFSLLGLGAPCYNGSGPVATFDVMQTVTGTRMSSVHLEFGTTSFIGIGVNATIQENLRFMHGMKVDSDDFFLSFQRQPIKYPNYQKTAVATTANTGWWMNIPYMEMRGLYTNVGNQSLGAVFGLNITNADLGQSPPKNCYGGYSFC